MPLMKAVTAAAHELARMIYTMLTKGDEYTDQRQDDYEERYRQRVLHHLAQPAEKRAWSSSSMNDPHDNLFITSELGDIY